jgi:Domain of unknown function (DUF4838)
MEITPAKMQDCKIRHPAEADSLRFAAEELQSYLAKIFGASPAISTEPFSAVGFCLGLFADTGVAEELVGHGIGGEQIAESRLETYAIVIAQERVCFYGNRPRAVLYAIYDFLRDVLGCEFAISADGIEKIPALTELRLEPSVTVEQASFPVRGLGFHTDDCRSVDIYLRMIDWLAKLKYNRFQFNIRLWESLSESLGPALADRDLDLDLGIHSLNFFLPESDYLEAHPGWYVEDGNRFGRQLRFANLESIPQALENILAFIKKVPQLRYLGLWPLDGTKFDPAEIASGQMGDLVLEYVNRIADGIAREHPELTIDHLAYVGYVSPPESTIPSANVMTSVCHYFDRNFTQPICDAWFGRARIDTEPSRAKAAGNFHPHRNHRQCCEDLRGWVELGETIVFSYYPDLNLSARCIFDIAEVIQLDMQYYQAVGAVGSLACYCMHTEFLWIYREIHQLADCLWNPDVDMAGREGKLMGAVFGDAGEAMRLFYRTLHHVQDQPLMAGFRLPDLMRGIMLAHDMAGYDPKIHQPTLGQIEARFDRLMENLSAATAKAETAEIGERIDGIRHNVIMQRAFARLGCHVLAAFGYRHRCAIGKMDSEESEAKARAMFDEALCIFEEWASWHKSNAPDWIDFDRKIKAYRVALETDFPKMQLPQSGEE